MNSTTIIKSFVSAFLLCVFALGITPKQVLHDILTNHQHTASKEKAGEWVTKDRFHCDDENLVAESPFVNGNCAIKVSAPTIFSAITDIQVASYFFLQQFFFELRGPPSVV